MDNLEKIGLDFIKEVIKEFESTFDLDFSWAHQATGNHDKLEKIISEMKKYKEKGDE